MGLFLGIGANIEMADYWVTSNNLLSPVLADSTEDVTPLFTVASPWIAIVDDNQICQYTAISVEDSTVSTILPTVLDLLIPEIGASVSEIEFGEALLEETVSIDFYVENSRLGILNVEYISSTDPAFTVDYTPAEIYAVDDSMLVTVNFTPVEIGAYEDTLIIESENTALSIPVSGIGFSNSVSDDNNKYPFVFTVKPAYPNPFNSNAVIEFVLNEKNFVNLEIFNSEGEIVAVLNNGILQQGNHAITFNADGLPSGIYFYRLSAGTQTVIDKMIFVK